MTLYAKMEMLPFKLLSENNVEDIAVLIGLKGFSS